MIIEINNLNKSFKDVHAVNDLSFSVRQGELFAFLGVNGAGKSTTINIISGILPKDSGTVSVCGHVLGKEDDAIKANTGVVFQNSVLDKRLNALDNLRSRAAMYGIFGKQFDARLKQLDDLFELSPLLKRPLAKLSGGQRRRIDIARALVHDPQLLILDEPTTGLDPQTRTRVWNVIEHLRKEHGLTVLLTTHYMEEAANSDYVLILDGGRKIVDGTPHELKSKYAAETIRFYSHADEASAVLGQLGLTVTRQRDYLDVEIKGTDKVTQLILQYPQLFDDYEVLKGNMDSVFLRVTGKMGKEE